MENQIEQFRGGNYTITCKSQYISFFVLPDH